MITTPLHTHVLQIHNRWFRFITHADMCTCRLTIIMYLDDAHNTTTHMNMSRDQCATAIRMLRLAFAEVRMTEDFDYLFGNLN